MRILHIVKTSEGASWATLQAAELVRLGADVHVALPAAKGSQVKHWEDAKAAIHIEALDYPAKSPWRLPAVSRRARMLVDSVRPDIIHSHHFGPTLVMRHTFGKRHAIPRIFQVPGPLHMEHWLYRTWDTASAGECDHWIASSRCIRDHYLHAGIERSRIFLSYYGLQPAGFSRERTSLLRRRLGIDPRAFVAGNISHIYAPKYHLGQRYGLKRHEDLIAALGIVLRKRSDVVGVLVGGPWGSGVRYQEHLRSQAQKIGKGRILMPGHLAPADVRKAWADFDCAIHVPISENCGGVVEPLLAGVPTIAGDIGGLPEVVMDGATGILVPTRNPEALAGAMLKVLANPEKYRAMARLGGELAAEMFDVRRTATEVYQVYRHILDRTQAPPIEFDPRSFVAHRNAAALQAVC
jgi:glycosyltransferase involved in cell wall biosynthesis